MIEAILVAMRATDEFGYNARALGVDDLEIRRAYLIEVPERLTAPQQAALTQWLADPVSEVAEYVTSESLREIGRDWRSAIWLGYKRGIVDNESESIQRIAGLLGIEASAAKLLTVYLSNDVALEQRVRQRIFNPNIEEISSAYVDPGKLVPLGEYVPAGEKPLRGLDEGQLAALGRENGRNLSLRQMVQIRGIEEQTGIATTDVLLEALDARWSDHCYHTTWRSLGKLLSRLMDAAEATRNPNIVSMFHDNAGIWDFYEGYGIAFKAETHNSPSAVSAYFGQLTKLGGVLRDILGAGLGADPVGVFEYTATGVPGSSSPIPNRPSPVQIATDTIRAIKEYGNTFGTPMMWSHMTFHPAYRAKPFALGGAIGLVPLTHAQKGIPETGDLVVLIGGLTGNDGIHGASGSSAGTVMDATSVQIGSPLEEVKFRGAIIDLRDYGCLRAITDVGGAGLNSAVGEMGDPVGVWLNTAVVPLKTAGLPMWRILLSESQERMILAVIPEKLALAREILLRHRVRTAVIGKFTGLGRYTVVHDTETTEIAIEGMAPDKPLMTGEVGMDVPYGLLDYQPDPIASAPMRRLPVRKTTWPALDGEGVRRVMPLLLGDPEVADQTIADSQYDSSVQGHESYGPYEGSAYPVRTGYWAARILPETQHAALFATAFSPWLFERNPVLALRQCFASVVGTMVLAGARRIDVALCDNFYTPHLSDNWAEWLSGMVDELAVLIRQFGTPVISGKDSSAGSVATPEGLIHVPPAVFLSALAKAPDFGRLLRNEWAAAGNLLVRIGPAFGSAAGTVAARALKIEADDVDALDVPGYRDFLDALETVSRDGWASGRQIGEGGLLTLLARGSIASGLGVELIDGLTPADLLAEHRAAALIEISAERVAALPPVLEPRVIGSLVANGPSLRLGGSEILTGEAQDAWASSFGAKIQ